MNLLKNFMPFLDAEGGAAGAAAPESVPSGPEAEAELMDVSDWTGAQAESDETGGDDVRPEPDKNKEDARSEQKPDTMPEKFKVKYNKQEMELTRDQMIEAAQKGMDYDRLRENRDRYMAPIERLARQAGMATDQFMNALDSLVKTNAVDVKKEQFMNLGMDERQASYFAEMAYENETLKNGQALQMRQMNERAQARQAVQERINRDVAEFEAKFPDLQTIPDEVIAEIRAGENPVVAYQGYLIRENGKKMKALEQNQRNRQIAAGPVKTIGTETADPFLEGLMNG